MEKKTITKKTMKSVQLGRVKSNSKRTKKLKRRQMACSSLTSTKLLL